MDKVMRLNRIFEQILEESRLFIQTIDNIIDLRGSYNILIGLEINFRKFYNEYV